LRHIDTPRRGPGLRKLIAYLPAIIWAVVVLGIGSMHDVPAPDTTLPLDKAAHFVMYGVLGALAGRGWLRTNRMHPVVLPVLFAIAVGAVDELHQRTVEGRSSDVVDFAADMAGVLVGFQLIARSRASLITGKE
jgi:VanZ family protein